MSGKMWIIFSAIVVVVIGGMVYMSTRERLDVSDLGKAASGRILPPRSVVAILKIMYLAIKTQKFY